MNNVPPQLRLRRQFSLNKWKDAWEILKKSKINIITVSSTYYQNKKKAIVAFITRRDIHSKPQAFTAEVCDFENISFENLGLYAYRNGTIISQEHFEFFLKK
mgnify:CR=1 FL=1